MISISSIIYAIPHFTTKDTLPEFSNGTRDIFLKSDVKAVEWSQLIHFLLQQKLFFVNKFSSIS